MDIEECVRKFEEIIKEKNRVIARAELEKQFTSDYMNSYKELCVGWRCRCAGLEAQIRVLERYRMSIQEEVKSLRLCFGQGKERK